MARGGSSGLPTAPEEHPRHRPLFGFSLPTPNPFLKSFRVTKPLWARAGSGDWPRPLLGLAQVSPLSPAAEQGQAHRVFISPDFPFASTVSHHPRTPACSPLPPSWQLPRPWASSFPLCSGWFLGKGWFQEGSPTSPVLFPPRCVQW